MEGFFQTKFSEQKIREEEKQPNERHQSSERTNPLSKRAETEKTKMSDIEVNATSANIT